MLSMRHGHTPDEQNWAPQWMGSQPGSGPSPVPMKSSMMHGIVILSEQVLKNWRAWRRRRRNCKSKALRMKPRISKPPLTGRGRRETPGSSVVGGLLKNRKPPSSSSSSPAVPSSPPEPSTSSLAGEDDGASEDVEATVLERSGVAVVDVEVVVMAAVLLLLLAAEDAVELALPVIMDIRLEVVELAMLTSICIRVLDVGAGVVIAGPFTDVAAVLAASDCASWAGAEVAVPCVSCAPVEGSPALVAIRPPPPIRKDCSSHGWYMIEHMSCSWRTQIR